MTLQGELSTAEPVVEYFVCFEGVGWPTDETDLTQGFDGDVFVTNDLNGDLATVLGCTIHYGLMLPRSISDELDPQTLEYSQGGMTFQIQDQDDKLRDTFRPHYTAGKVGELSHASGLAVGVTTVEIDNLDSDFDEDDIAWIGGREAVLLGSESDLGGGISRFTGCTRGYLGTPEGRFDSKPTGLEAFSWEDNTAVHDFCRYWWGRRIILFAHVPGEVVGNCVRIYNGKLRPFKSAQQGIAWAFQSKAESHAGRNNVAEPCTGIYLENNWFDVIGSDRANIGIWDEGQRVLKVNHTNNYDWEHWMSLFVHGYCYRNAEGGNAGVRTAILADSSSPQSVLDSDSRAYMHTRVAVGGQLLYADTQYDADISSRVFSTRLEPLHTGNEQRGLLKNGERVQFPLSHEEPTDSVYSRWRINSNTFSNPIEIALCFLTSMPNEYHIADAAAGSTQTVVDLGSPGFTDDEWIGYALWKIITDGDKYPEARTITDNDSDQITVERAFVDTVSTGDEFQIRNTVYDILPLGWGMGVHHSKIDVASFEAVRDKYMPTLHLSDWCLGVGGSIDLWEMVRSQLLEPFGVFAYVDRKTGKLSARYVGESVGDGVEESFVAVSAQNILDFGDTNHAARAPAESIRLAVRGNNVAIVKPRYRDVPGGAGSGGVTAKSWQRIEDEVGYRSMMAVGEGLEEITVRSKELDDAFDPGEMRQIKVESPFVKMGSQAAAWLTTQLIGRLKRQAIPPPEVDILLDMSYWLTAQAGALLSVTDTTQWNPLDPYDGGRGWTNVPCRVISSEIVLSETNPGVRCRVQVLDAINAGLIAPAAVISSKGNDVNGDYLVVEDANFVRDPDGTEKDWFGFRVDDVISIRDINGFSQEAEIIAAFGTNQSTLPDDADTSRIYVDGTIARTIAAGDYVTFESWISAGRTSNMETFVALADANLEIGTDPHEAFEYA